MEHYPAGNFNLKVDRLYLAIKGQSEGTHLCEFAFKLCSFDIKGLSFARKTCPVSLHCQHQLKTQEESADLCCLHLILTLVFVEIEINQTRPCFSYPHSSVFAHVAAKSFIFQALAGMNGAWRVISLL